jgi:hypothetical protein
MSTTTDHHTAGKVEDVADRERRQQRPPEQLLARRERLARILDERESHDLKDAGDYRIELLALEQCVGHCWPVLWETRFVAEWAAYDVVLMHRPNMPRADCGICLSTTRQAGQRLGQRDGTGPDHQCVSGPLCSRAICPRATIDEGSNLPCTSTISACCFEFASHHGRLHWQPIRMPRVSHCF